MTFEVTTAPRTGVNRAPMLRDHCTGVILAAGRGSRINPLSASIPKPLLPICNKPVMQYQIELMRDAGIRDIVIVVGHLNEAIRTELGDGKRLGVSLRYVLDEQPQGIASSLALVEGQIADHCIVFLGDIFFSMKPLAPWLNRMADPDVHGVVFVKHEPDREAIKRNFSVITDDRGFITKVIEKPTNPTNDLKGCGIYVFDEGIFDAIRRTPRSALRNEYELTDAIQVMVDRQGGVIVGEAVNFDLNLTYPEDLLRCNLLHLRAQGLRNLVGSNVQLAQGSRLDEAILGDRVQVPDRMTIRRSVIFPNTELPKAKKGGKQVLEHCLIHPHGALSLNVARL